MFVRTFCPKKKLLQRKRLLELRTLLNLIIILGQWYHFPGIDLALMEIIFRKNKVQLKCLEESSMGPPQDS